MKISDQTYSIGAFLGKDPEDVKQQKQDKLEQQIDEVRYMYLSIQSTKLLYEFWYIYIYIYM